MVINELPVGSIVRLGRFGFSHSDELVEIDWIKASKKNEFISQKVLLGTRYDAYEGWRRSNNNYELSNIRQFINSENSVWYQPTHPDDAPTDYVYLDSGVTINMSKYNGLLYYFRDEELSFIEKQDGDYLRLPKAEEILGGFQYFKRYGIRGRPTDEWGHLVRADYHPGVFVPYFVIGNGKEPNVYEVTISGSIDSKDPHFYSGIRPVCILKPDAEIIRTGKNTYKMNLLSGEPIKYFKVTRSIDWLLET